MTASLRQGDNKAAEIHKQAVSAHVITIVCSMEINLVDRSLTHSRFSGVRESEIWFFTGQSCIMKKESDL